MILLMMAPRAGRMTKFHYPKRESITCHLLFEATFKASDAGIKSGYYTRKELYKILIKMLKNYKGFLGQKTWKEKFN